MRKLKFTEICILIIIAIISFIVNLFSGYYIKIEDNKMIYNKFYTSNAQGISVNSENEESIINIIEEISSLNNDFILYRTLSNSGQENDIRGIYYKGDIHIPKMKDGHFITENYFNNKVAVIGKDLEDEIIESEGKKYIECYGEEFEVVGIMGESKPSDLDNMIFINLSDAIRIMGSNGMYVVDSKIKDNIDKFTTDFYNKNPKEIEKIDLNSGKVSGLGFNLSLIYLLTTISLITSLILILYYYIENEKRKIAIKKLCGFTNKALAKELIKKQFILVFIGFIIGCILFLVFKEKFEIRDVKVSNMIIAYILVLICNFFTLVLPVKRILTIDMSILLK